MTQNSNVSNELSKSNETSLLNKLFKLSENQTTIRTEILAGITTFLTMSYIMFVNPQILHLAGMSLGAVFVATCLVAALGSFLIAFISNYPIAVAPGMGLNAYFTFVIVQGLGYSWESTLGAVFISGVIFLFLTITKIRRYIIESIPKCLTLSIAVGIGFFIILLALQSSGVVVPNAKTFMQLGNIMSIKSILFFIGFFLIVALEELRIPGAILIGILSLTLISIIAGISHFHGIFALPPSLASTAMHLNFHDLLTMKGVSIIFTFLLVALFDSTGSMIGLLQQANYSDDKKRTQRISHALMSDSIATIAGSLLGTSSTSPFIESAAGIRAGGKTGLTAVTVGLLFLASLFLSPLAQSIPSFAVAPAMFYVGILMVQNVTLIDKNNLSEFVPAVITFLMIPFGFSIANGIGLGIISYIILKFFKGERKAINPVLLILAIVFIIYFILMPH